MCSTRLTKRKERKREKVSKTLLPWSTTVAFQRLWELTEGRSIVVIGHARPDGDCIGSQVALARSLRAAGRDVVCVNPSPVPRRLQFLVRDEPVLGVDALPEGDQVAIYVDCADQARAGSVLQKRFPEPFGNIDHHVSNEDYAVHNCVQSDSSATCEILAALFLELDLKIDAETAQALYTGILTDTGQFRFATTTHLTFKLAAELVALGANPVEAGHELYEREPAGKLQLLQRYLASFEIHSNGRICVGTLAEGVFSDTETGPEDTEGMVDYARAIDGVMIGCLIEERKDGIKVSLRAENPTYRVDQIAAQFGGGGHACAAGLNITGIEAGEFRKQLIDALEKRMLEVDAETGN
jgi:phosphoesterase RecJ-like protein